MARNSLAKKPEKEDTAAARKEDSKWAICLEPQCLKERRIVDGRMLKHNRYDETRREMVWCEGGGQPPVGNQAVPDAVFTDE